MFVSVTLKGGGMAGYDVDEQIKNYWGARGVVIPEEILEKIKEFCDATGDNPVDAGEFLHHLNLSFLDGYFNELYSRKPDYPAVAMFKTMLLMDIRKMKFLTELERALKEDHELAEALGFVRDGIVLIPGYKNLWHFCNIRLKGRWDELFALLRKEVVRRAEAFGLKMGEDTVQDATPIKALSHDEEAEYNAHYEVKGYKVDVVTDLKTGIPLSKRVTGINCDESNDLIPQLEEIMKAGINVKNHWIDGGYDDYHNLAWMGVHKIRAHHPVHKNWVHNEKGEVSKLKKLYNKHWKDEDYRANAPTESILLSLFEKGYDEEVGSFFRNDSMERYQEDPEAYERDYHKRSREEGNNGYWKEHLGIEDRLTVKGMERVDRYITRNMCALLAIALCRLQHGVKENLTSVAYFT